MYKNVSHILSHHSAPFPASPLFSQPVRLYFNGAGDTANVGRTNRLKHWALVKYSFPSSGVRLSAPIIVVNLGILANQLLLALLVGPVSSDLVAVFFGLQEGDQVDTSPHLLTGQFAVLKSAQFGMGQILQDPVSIEYRYAHLRERLGL